MPEFTRSDLLFFQELLENFPDREIVPLDFPGPEGNGTSGSDAPRNVTNQPGGRQALSGHVDQSSGQVDETPDPAPIDTVDEVELIMRSDNLDRYDAERLLGLRDRFVEYDIRAEESLDLARLVDRVMHAHGSRQDEAIAWIVRHHKRGSLREALAGLALLPEPESIAPPADPPLSNLGIAGNRSPCTTTPHS